MDDIDARLYELGRGLRALLAGLLAVDRGPEVPTRESTPACVSAAPAQPPAQTSEQVIQMYRNYEQGLKHAKAQHAQAAARGESADQAAITALVESLTNTLSDDYTLIDPGGNVVNRERIVDHIRNLHVFDEYERDDHQVRVYGNTALYTSRVRVVGTFQGHNVSGVYRETHHLKRRGENWEITHTHMTLIQPIGRLLTKQQEPPARA